MDKKKLLLIVSAGVTLLYLDFEFALRPQLANINTSTSAIAQLKQDIANLKSNLAAAQAAKKKETQSVKDATQRSKKIISEGEIPALLESISSQANKNNLRVLQIRPAKEPAKEAKVELAAPEKFLPWTIDLELSCDYHRLGAFINTLENDPRFMDVNELKISNESGDSLLQKATLELKTYVTR